MGGCHLSGCFLFCYRHIFIVPKIVIVVNVTVALIVGDVAVDDVAVALNELESRDAFEHKNQN